MSAVDFGFELLFILFLVLVSILGITILGAFVASLFFGIVAFSGWIFTLTDGGGIID